mgnify:CR=1 FL=1
MANIKKWLRQGIPVMLTILFCVISVISLATISHMQGNARVINYTGIVRGATQRLIKQEMNGSPNDDLIPYLDGILSELSTGQGENGLVALPDAEFQGLLAKCAVAGTKLRLRSHRCGTARTASAFSR